MSHDRTRLYVKLAAGDSAEMRLEAALQAAPVDAVLISAGAKGVDGSLQRLVALTQSRQAAALMENDADLAAELGADGVHLTWTKALEDEYKAARQRLGADRIVGVDAGTSRHDAMTLGEMGADYIAFGPAGTAGETPTGQLDLVSWWAELFEVPCVALGVTDASSAKLLADAGADFVGVELPLGLTAAQAVARMRTIADAVAITADAATERGDV